MNSKNNYIVLFLKNLILCTFKILVSKLAQQLHVIIWMIDFNHVSQALQIYVNIKFITCITLCSIWLNTFFLLVIMNTPNFDIIVT
jgi:hypothetical protein